MSAEILRRAAALMRERANGSIPGPWRWEVDEDTGEQFVTSPRVRDICAVHEWSTGPRNGEHIASWHPDVALAAADLLDAQADAGYWEADPDSRAALTVARAYLGGDS